MNNLQLQNNIEVSYLYKIQERSQPPPPSKKGDYIRLKIKLKKQQKKINLIFMVRIRTVVVYQGQTN